MKKSQLKQLIKEEIFKVLNEGKQVGDLYHFTPLKNIPRILNSQRLNPNDEGQISTSRRPNMSVEVFTDEFPNRMDNVPIARMVLDGNKISNKYEIRPFSYKNEDLGEEQILVNHQYFSFFPYLKRIDIFLNDKKINNKIIELFQQYNISYKIYQGTPESNSPYNQSKEGNPEDINVIPVKQEKRKVYTLDDMYFPGVKTQNKIIKIYTSYFNITNKETPIEKEVIISPEYPDYYVLLGFLSNKKYYEDYYNLNGDKLNVKVIPVPMFNDPKWRQKWKNINIGAPYNRFHEGIHQNAYLLIPKNEVDV
jgi:hypothetical protein